jgi:fibronectin type 3 domain-containing protein
MSDTARYIGLGVGKFGTNGSDLVSATVIGNVVVRCGGNAYNQQQPALHIGNGGDGQSSGNVGGAVVMWNTVLNSLYNGVGFSTSNNITFKNNTINSPGLRGIVISPNFYPAPTGSASITGNTVTGLKNGQAAYINLSQNGGYVVSPLSGNSWQGGTTPPPLTTPPDAPTGVQAGIAASQVTLSWPPVTRAETYTVKRATAAAGPYATLATGLVGNTYVDAGLSAGTQYFYVLTATNDFGESADSAGLSVLLNAPAAAASAENAPTEGAAQAFDGTTNTKWYNAGAGSTGWLQYYFGGAARTVVRYDISSGNDSPGRDPKNWQFLGSHDGGSWTVLDTRTSQTFSARKQTRQFAITNTTAYEYYRLNITASNGDTSLQLSELAFTYSDAAFAPTGLTATSGNGQVALTWGAVSGATGYQVRRATVSSGPYTDVAVAPSASYLDTGLTNGTTYYYVIATITSAGSSANSSQIRATPQPAPPLAPSSVTATPGDGQVTLDWPDSTGATGYTVKRATVSGGPYTVVGTSASSSYVDTSATNGTAYYYIVIASNGGGQSATSPPSNATTPRTALQAWQISNFGSVDDTRAAQDADPDMDGIPNLIEYATGSLPLNANAASPAVLGLTPAPTRLTLSFNRVADPTLTYEVMAANNVNGPWTSIWSSSAAQNVAGSVTVTDSITVNGQTSRYLRLKVSISAAGE